MNNNKNSGKLVGWYALQSQRITLWPFHLHVVHTWMCVLCIIIEYVEYQAVLISFTLEANFRGLQYIHKN